MDELSEEEKIETYERYLAGATSESEAREKLGDSVIDGMREDREAFAAATEIDTSDFLQQDDDDA
ncbi:hypothetical protein [Halostagnicola bangensis]